MAQLAILDKVARNLDQVGLAYTRTSTSVVVTNGGNALTVSLVDAVIGAPQGGVDPTVSPFLGIGVSAPSTIKMKSASTATATIAAVIDSDIAARVFRLLCGFANDVVLENGNAGYSLRIRGHVDVLGLGQ